MNRNEEIDVELNGMGSPLVGLSKHVPYTAPAGYFSAFSAKIIGGIDTESNASIPQVVATPYSVPDDYFEQLNKSLLHKVGAQTVLPQGTPNKLYSLPLRSNWAVAAVLALVIAIGGYTMFSATNYSAQSVLANVSQHDIADYLNEQYNPEKLQTESVISIEQIQLDETDIEHYLVENGWN